MTLHLCVLSHGPTAATRSAAFPGNEPLLSTEASHEERPPHVLRDWATAEVRVSPRRAALQTAARYSLAGKCDPDLAELDYGAWTGCTISDIAASVPDALEAWMTNPDFRGHGGESRNELSRRTSRWLDALHAHRGRILAVSHVAVIRSLVIGVLRAPAEAFWGLDIAPSTMTEFSHDGRRWALRSLAIPLSQRD
jgi:broad specificity phosphatase PhoE